jgi:hypothetical protein
VEESDREVADYIADAMEHEGAHGNSCAECSLRDDLIAIVRMRIFTDRQYSVAIAKGAEGNR